MKKELLFFVFNCCAILLLQAQPLQKSATNVDAGNTKLSGATFSYRLTYNCSNTSGPCSGARVVDLLPPEVEFISTVPATPSGNVTAINVTPNYMGTGRTQVEFVLVDPLPAGNSGDLTINVRFPNGSTPDGTVATNTADGINLETTPGTFTTPPVDVTAAASEQVNTSLTLTTAPANLDMAETYRYRFEVPNVNGALDVSNISPVTVTLPPGAVFQGSTPAADCEPGCIGTTPPTITYSGPFGPIGPGQRQDIFINVEFPSATFTSGNNVTTSAIADGTPLGEPPQQFGPANITHPVTTFVPMPDLNHNLNLASGTPNPPTLNQDFSFAVDVRNSGNVPLNNQRLSFTVPIQMQVNSVSTGSYANPPTSVNVIYETNLSGGFLTLGNSPGSTNATLPIPALAAGEYVTRIRWEYGQTQPGMNSVTRPLITGRIIDPDNAGNPVAIGDDIDVCSGLSAEYNGGLGQISCQGFFLSGPFVQLNPRKENLSGSGPFLVDDEITYRLRVRSDARSSEPMPLEDLIATDLLPRGLSYMSWTYDDRGTGLPAPQLEEIPDFTNGRTLLRWRWNAGSGDLGINEEVWITLETRVNTFAQDGSLNNQLSLDSDAPTLSQRCSGSSQTDNRDLDADGDMSERFCTALAGTSINVIVPPSIVSIVRNDPNPTNAGTVSWRVTFDEAVTGVSVTDFALTGIADAMVTNVMTENSTSEDDVWIVTASSGTGSGNLGLNLITQGNIRDNNDNLLYAFTASPLPFVGEVYNIDRDPPTAVLNVANPISGNATHTFTVTYSDNNNVAIGTLDDMDIRVTGPNGYDELATLQNVNDNTDGTPRVATYQIPAPGGTWDDADAGVYSITWVMNQVEDVLGNMNASDLLGSFNICPSTPGFIIYVNATAANGGDGTSWNTAFNKLQDALSFACDCANITEIWVAEGTYYPDEGIGQVDDERTSTFQLCSGVALYGGFPDTGNPGFGDRDVENNTTVLSGDLMQDDAANVAVADLFAEVTRADNAIHVVTGSNTDATAILDGFTITAGNANGDIFLDQNDGGGMFSENGSPTVNNCIFEYNSCSSRGGGMSNENSSPMISNCTFANNYSDFAGGGMATDGSTSAPMIVNCVFRDNVADNLGGGMYIVNRATPFISNCSFLGNTADDEGGGVAIDNECNPTFVNCVFSGNLCNEEGGGFYIESDSEATVISSTFSGNSAGDAGGGIYNANRSTLTLINSIVWNNQANGVTNSTSASVFNEEDAIEATTNISYSIIANSGGSDNWNDDIGTDDDNNKDEDPFFVEPVNPADAPTTAGDLNLLYCSPAIDMGSNEAVPQDEKDVDEDLNTDELTPDLNLEDRIFNAIVDMGAFEFQGPFFEVMLADGATICSTKKLALADLNPMITYPYDSDDLTYTWSIVETDGDNGMFADVDETDPTAGTYMPGEAAVERGSVTLQLTVENESDPCEAMTAEIVVEILKAACGEFPWRGDE
jgi:hypothetical protein